ncbi:MAG: hypothetical protein M3P41_16540 [Actinomycetota bacterium]|nr:hypothetical protein [Actinomycetota bacterium]
MAKLAREQAVREKRARKQEKKDDKKQAAADALIAEAEGALEVDGDAEVVGVDVDATAD